MAKKSASKHGTESAVDVPPSAIQDSIDVLVQRNRPMMEARSRWQAWSNLDHALLWREIDTWEGVVAAIVRATEALQAVGRENALKELSGVRPLLPATLEAFAMARQGVDQARIVEYVKSWENTPLRHEVHTELTISVWFWLHSFLQVREEAEKEAYATVDAVAALEIVPPPPVQTPDLGRASQQAVPTATPSPRRGESPVNAGSSPVGAGSAEADIDPSRAVHPPDDRQPATQRRRKHRPPAPDNWIYAVDTVDQYAIARSTLQGIEILLPNDAVKRNKDVNLVLFRIDALESVLRSKGRLDSK